MGRAFRLAFIVVYLVFGSASAEITLERAAIRPAFDELLHFHVEHRKLSPALLQRAFKIFLEQFDPGKIYLLKGEVQAICNVTKHRLEKGVKGYKKDQYKEFSAIAVMLERAVERGKRYRQEVQKEIIISTRDLRPLCGETYLSYAKNEKQLRERIKKHVIRLAMEEKEVNQLVEWTPSEREQICSLFEGRFSRKEAQYSSEREIKEHYFSLHTLKALAKSLDAHTAYFSPEEAHRMRTALEKQFEGVGVILRQTLCGVVITELIPGSPAEASGKVAPGDQILKINGIEIEGMSFALVLDAMKGAEGEDLRLVLLAKGAKYPHAVSLPRKKIEMTSSRLQTSSISYGDGVIGVLTLPSFYEGGGNSSAEKDIRKALLDLKKEGPIRGLVLDMRQNYGGFLSQAVKVTGLFISHGVVVISKYARGEIKYLRNLDGTNYYDGPLVVLTSRASASAAEIVAQALQDYGTALIVGDERTYGKGTIQYQTVTDRSATSFYKVTVGRYYTVSGKSTQIEGVRADIVVPTQYSALKIGERFLDYPLKSDQVSAAYIDPLSDVNYRSRLWFQQNYLPHLQSQQDQWGKALPTLKKNSRERIENNPNYAAFLEANKKGRRGRRQGISKESKSNDEDLPLTEAINIVKDMSTIQT